MDEMTMLLALGALLVVAVVLTLMFCCEKDRGQLTDEEKLRIINEERRKDALWWHGKE